MRAQNSLHGPASPLFLLMVGWLMSSSAPAAEYVISRISLNGFTNRDPQISDTGLIGWQAYRLGADDEPYLLDIHLLKDAQILPLGVDVPATANLQPRLRGDTLVYTIGTVRNVSSDLNSILVDPILIPEGAEEKEEEDPEGLVFNTASGDREIMLWRDGQSQRITQDYYDDGNPDVDGNVVVWQRGRRWPFGWEIFLWEAGAFVQITTNLFYDQGPQMHQGELVWYGWDGENYQIYHYDHGTQIKRAITDNRYDDIKPLIENGVIVWEGYVTFSSDIFMYRDGEISKLSNNVDDDQNPRLWNGQVVWEGFDGDYFQIYHFDGTTTTQLTNTRYDNKHPDIRDGVITWMGFVDSFEPEIFVWLGGPDPVRLTANQHVDQSPRTANGKIVWEGRIDGVSHIFLAEPR